MVLSRCCLDIFLSGEATLMKSDQVEFGVRFPADSAREPE